MTAPARRLGLGLGLVGVFVLSVRVATYLEQRAVVTPAPGVATGAAIAHDVDRAELMADLRQLASAEFEGRRTGSSGGRKARAWIEGRFREIGLQVAGTAGYLEAFTFSVSSGHGTGQPEASRTTYDDAANVLGRLDGSEPRLKTIVVSAHYDHLGVKDRAVYYGADDNASGVATLLASARWFRSHPPRHPILFAAFDGEELGLQGAKAFVHSNLLARSQVALDVNLDMVSRNDRNEIYAAGAYQSPWLTPYLADVQRHAGVKIRLGHDRPPQRPGDPDDWTQESDHGAFQDAGLPFLYFGVEDHADYHKPTDTADKIDPAFFGTAADMIVEALRTLDARLP